MVSGGIRRHRRNKKIMCVRDYEIKGGTLEMLSPGFNAKMSR